jgi:hypothetical protein
MSQFDRSFSVAVNQRSVSIGNPCQKFAIIAVKQGFITPEQAKTALAEQMDDDLANKHHRLIGGILLEKGWITPQQIELVLGELFPKAYSHSPFQFRVLAILGAAPGSTLCGDSFS